MTPVFFSAMQHYFKKMLIIAYKSSPETQGQLVGAGKSLNRREKIRAKKTQE